MIHTPLRLAFLPEKAENYSLFVKIPPTWDMKIYKIPL